MTLDDLGPRICILGPSNSGKSTLAEAISRARGLPAIHLDQLYHLPNTNWLPRQEADFLRLHGEAIKGSRWVMEGNYSWCLPQRLAMATGVIRLDISTPRSFMRYLRRCWVGKGRRGTLEGGGEHISWTMIHHILVTTRRNRSRNDAMFEGIVLPKFRFADRQSLDRFYRSEALEG